MANPFADLIPATTTPAAPAQPMAQPAPQPALRMSAVPNGPSISNPQTAMKTSTAPAALNPAPAMPSQAASVASPQPVSAKSSNPFSDLVPPAAPATQTKSNPFSDLIPAEKPLPQNDPAYFATTTKSGASFGPSKTLDTMGRPLLDYRKPGDTATTTDMTRTDTKFDPTVAQPVSKDARYNPRDTIGEANQRIIQKAGPSDQIDHRMALAIAGSNEPQNLKKIPAAENQADGKFEYDLASQVSSGKISLFDAQKLEAANKDLPTPFTGTQTPSFWDNVVGYLKSVAGNVGSIFGQQAHADTNDTPAPSIAQGTGRTLPLPPATDPLTGNGALPEKGTGITDASTPSTSTAPDTVDIFKQLFVNPTSVRPAFDLPSDSQKIGGGAVIGTVANIGSRLIEAIPKFTTVLAANIAAIRNGGQGQVTTPFHIDASRLGLPVGDQVVDSGTRMINDFNDRMNKNPDHPVENGLMSIVSGPIQDAFDAEIGGGQIDSAAEAVLDRTGYSRGGLDAMQRLGINPNELKAQNGPTALKLVTNQAKSEVQKIVQEAAATPDWNGKFSNDQIARLNAIVQDVKTVGAEYGAKSTAIPTKLGQGLRDVADTLSKPFGAADAPYRLPPDFSKEALPGYRSRPGQAPAFGLSTEEVEPVGFGDKGGEKPVPSPTDSTIQNGPTKAAEGGRGVVPKTSEEAADTYYNDAIKPQIGTSKTIEVAGDNIKAHFGNDYDSARSDLYAKASYNIVQRLIKDPAIKNITFLAGGPGSGKSEFIGKNLKAANSTDVVYDNSLSNEAGTRHLLDLAEEYGKQVHVSGIIANRSAARDFTIHRAGVTGRAVPDSVFDSGHDNYIKTAHNLLEDGTLNSKNSDFYDLRNIRSEADARAKINQGKTVDNPLAVFKELRHTIGNDTTSSKTYQGQGLSRTKPNSPQNPSGSGRSRQPSSEIGSDTEGEEIRPTSKEINAGNSERDKVDAKESKKAGTPLEQHLSELQTKRSVLQDALDNHPAKGLMKHVNKNGELPEALGSGQSKFGKVGDQLAQDLGFKDSEEARTAAQDYKLQQKKLGILKGDIQNIRKLVARSKLEDADAKSLNALLNRNATKTEIDSAKQARLEDIKQAENKTQEELKQMALENEERQRKIDQAKYDSTKSKTLYGKAKQALFPTSALDKVTQPIVEKWFQGVIDAKQAGVDAFNDALKKGPQNFQEIINFQAGSQTPYIREAFDEMGTDFKRRGLSFGWKDNYMPDVWKDSANRQAKARADYMKTKGMTPEEIAQYEKGMPLDEQTALRLKLRPNFAKARFWPDYVTGMAHGLTPKYTIPADLIGYYKEAGERAINAKTFISTLKKEAKLLSVDEAPDTWDLVTTRFSGREALKAPPALADLINGKFRDEDNLNLYESGMKAMAGVSRFLQDMVVSGGLPFSVFHPFGTAQATRIVTTMIGDIATGQGRAVLTDLKASFAFMRSNSNAASIKWFQSKEGTIAMMARNGIDLTDRVGGRNYRTITQGIKDAVSDDTGLRGVAKTTAAEAKFLFHKAIPEKAFASLMPQIKIVVFEGAYRTALAHGMPELEAEKLAAATTKASEGIAKETGRSDTTKQTMSSIFFAPPYREGLVNIFLNAGKSFTTDFHNPTYARNRSFLIGLAVTLAAMEYANYKINGHSTFSNPPGRELALRIPLPDGQVGYYDLGPSLLTVPRNLVEGSFALAKGDVSTSIEKGSSMLSMPLQLITQVWANRDYFGQPIWKTTDDGATVYKKIGAYVGLEASHPYVKQLYEYASGKQNSLTSLVNALGLPLKTTTLTSEQTSAFYDNITAQQQAATAAKNAMMPTYQKLQDMKNSGDVAGANKIYNALSVKDKAVYDSIKKSEALKDTKAREIKMQTVYDNLQQLKAEGRNDEANADYMALSPADQHAYDLVKARAIKNQ